MPTCPACGKSYDPLHDHDCELWHALPLNRSYGTPLPPSAKELTGNIDDAIFAQRRADEDRALRDRLAMDLFRDDRSKDGYFEAETSARVALDDADIFMAERAKRDKDHG